MVILSTVGAAPTTMTQSAYCRAKAKVSSLAPSSRSSGPMKRAVSPAKRSPPSSEKRSEKEATRFASSPSCRPSRRATSVPPPTPAMFATAMQTLKIGKISEAPATM